LDSPVANSVIPPLLNVTFSYDDGANTLTVDAAGGTDTRIDVSEAGSLVLSEPTDVNFTESGAASVSVSDDGDGTATVDISATDTDTQLSKEEVQDDAWDVLTGTQTLINVTYDDANNNVDFVVDEAAISHDNLSGFVSNEHVDHSTVSVTTSGGLTGGGDLTATRDVSIADGGVTEAKLDATDTPSDGEILSWNNTAGQFEWVVDSTGSGGSAIVLDLADDGSNESTDLTEIATTNDSNNIVTEPAADKMLIDMSANWPTADDVPDSAVDHDQTTNFVSDEHVDHSTVSISSGTGLTGGGDLTSSRTLSLNALTSNLEDAASPNATAAGQLLIWHGTNSQFENATLTAGSNVSITNGDASIKIDATDTDTTYSAGDGLNLSGTTFDVNESQVDHDSLNQFVSNEHIDHSTVSITTSGGLTGGGDLTATRDISISDGGVTEAKLDVTDTPSDGEVLSWNNTAGQFEWIASGGGSAVDILEGGTQVVGTASDIDFVDADFNITDEGSGEAGVALNTNSSYTLPSSDGTDNQVLQTDGAGNVTFVTLPHSDLTSINSDDHHTRPSAGTFLTDSSNTFSVNTGDGLENDGSGNIRTEEKVTLSSGGMTEFATGLSNEEVDRFVLQTGETAVLERLEVRGKGGGSSTSVSVRVQDVTAASTVASQDLGGTTKDAGSSGTGNTLAVQLSNSSGNTQNLSWRAELRIQGS